jgi:dihydrolipoamide dehydrogenase
MNPSRIVIVGAGPGGYVAALRARQLGLNVTLIERDRIGGVCLNWGCVPTKALLRAAEVLELTRAAGKFGVKVAGVELDWPAVLKRKDEVVTQLVGGVEVLLRKAGVEIVKGDAHFRTPYSLAVAASDGQEREIPFDQAILATGSAPASLPIPGLDLPQVIGSDQALALPALPQRMLIIGGGAIGVEFASLFHSCGVDITLVEVLPRLIPAADHDVGAGLAWSLGEKGVKIHTSSKVAKVAPAGGDAVTCTVEGPGGTTQVTVDRVLVAVGRRPNVNGLRLEVAGVRASPKGIEVDSRMRTSAAGVYAIGDAVGGAMLAHVAMRQGVVAAENAAGLDSFMDYKAVPACIFCAPEVATVGLSEEAARSAGYAVKVGKFALVNNGKALAIGDTDGFVKIVADETSDEILGVHIVGPHASDLILEGTLALNLEATLAELDTTIHPHPTLGEAIAEAALAVHGRSLHLPAKASPQS